VERVEDLVWCSAELNALVKLHVGRSIKPTNA